LDNLCSKYGKGKVFCVLLFSLSALLVVMAVFSHMSYSHITYRGYRFRLSHIESGRVVFVEPNGSELVGTSGFRGTGKVTIYVFDEVISHELRTVSTNDNNDRSFTFSGGELAQVFTFPNGEEVVTSWWANNPRNRDRNATPPEAAEEWQLYQSIRRYLTDDDMRPLIVAVPFGGSLFIALGAWLAIDPRRFWEWEHMFTVANGEPTEFALVMHRFSGYLMMIGATAFGVFMLYLVALR